MERTGETLDEFTARYEPASTNNAKLLLVFMVFLLVLPMALFFLRKRNYLSAYITAAFELMAFHLWVSTIVLGTAFRVVGPTAETHWYSIRTTDDDALPQCPAGPVHVWVTIGIGRRFFGCTWVGAIWRSVAMLFGLQFALTAYRILLFVVTFWTGELSRSNARERVFPWMVRKCVPS